MARASKTIFLLGAYLGSTILHSIESGDQVPAIKEGYVGPTPITGAEKVEAPCADGNIPRLEKSRLWEKLSDVEGQYLSYQGEEKLKDEMMQNRSNPREVMNPQEMQVPTISTWASKHSVADNLKPVQWIEKLYEVEFFAVPIVYLGERKCMRGALSHNQGKVSGGNLASPSAWGEERVSFPGCMYSREGEGSNRPEESGHKQGKVSDRNSAIPSAGGGESDSFPGRMYSGKGEGEGSNILDESSHKKENMSCDTAPPCGPSSSSFAATAPASTALSRRHYIYSLSAEGHVFGSHFGFSIKAAASLPDV